MSDLVLSHLNSWKKQTIGILSVVSQFIFPPVCVACRQAGAVLCSDCRRDIYWLREAFCPTCSQTAADLCGCQPRLSVVYAAVAYLGPIPKAIHELKYKGQFALSAPLADIMVAAWLGEWDTPDYIIPIPLHKSREKKRGYNQAELLARAFSHEMGIACVPQLLWRIRETTPQVGLNMLERKQNVKQAFWATQDVKQRDILLIDDVYTTGATLAAAAEALYQAGARTVRGFTLARTITH